LTGRGRELKIILAKGGEVHEMDVPPCNPLLDLWFVAMVLSKTLNGSSEDKRNHSELFKDFKGRYVDFRPFSLLEVLHKRFFAIDLKP